VIACPVLERSQVQAVYGTQTGGYGYNKAVGTHKLIEFPTSQTYLFSDSALLTCFSAQSCTMQESDAILGPVPLQLALSPTDSTDHTVVVFGAGPVAYAHVRNAEAGCFIARVERCFASD